MWRSVGIRVVLTVAAASGCSSGGDAAATVRLHPGHYAFRLGGKVAVGDKIVCLGAGSTSVTARVSKPGHGVGSAAFDFDVSTLRSGRVIVHCPRADALAP